MALSRWEIKAALGHGTAQRIADELGVDKSVVSEVIAGKQHNRRVQVAIARKIGKPVDEVFAPKDEVLAATGGSV